MGYPWHAAELKALLARKERLPHALLLRGPGGIGKLAFAETVAKALLCERPAADGEGCGLCSACQWMAQAGHPDLRRLEPESFARQDATEAGAEEASDKKEKLSTQISVEQVRSISDFIHMTSHRGGMKVILIHPAEALNIAAANALLKNLEEPPPQTCFLLVSHRWHQLLPTIKSRCQHIGLAPPSIEAARQWLAGQGVPNPAVALAHAGGAPLLAAGYDEAYWKRREWFLKSLVQKDMNAMALANEIRGDEPAMVVGWLQKWAYDVARHQASGAVSYNPDFADAIAALARRVDRLDAARFLRRMVRLQRIVAHPLNARLFFEDLLLSYAAYAQGQPLSLAA
jgi:DNA polymerase-3 subunit delta'